MVSVVTAKNTAPSTFKSNKFVPQYTKPIMIGSEGDFFLPLTCTSQFFVLSLSHEINL